MLSALMLLLLPSLAAEEPVFTVYLGSPLGSSATPMLRLRGNGIWPKKLSSSIPLRSTDHEQPKLVYDVIELQDFFGLAVQ